VRYRSSSSIAALCLSVLGVTLVGSPDIAQAQAGSPAAEASTDGPADASTDGPVDASTDASTDGDPKQACIAAYEKAQSLRQSDQLLAAREQALFCAQDSCPDVVRNDCATWLGEIDAGTPTVTFDVRGPEGEETSSVSVESDGTLIKERLDGKAVPVDPGEHTFRFRFGDGSEVREITIVIREGEKNRKIEVSFGGESTSEGSPGGSPSGGGGGIPAATLVLGGVGIVGIGMFAVFGLMGTSDKSTLEDDCAPNCKEAEVDSVRTKLIVADISLAVGVVSLAAGAIIWATSGGSSAEAEVAGLTFNVAPTFGGFESPNGEAAALSGINGTVGGRF